MKQKKTLICPPKEAPLTAAGVPPERTHLSPREEQRGEFCIVETERSSDRYAGTKALWVKVIIRAAFDWVSYRDSDKLLQRKIAENAETWLFGQSHLFNSFDNICFSLGICTDDVRKWIRGLSKDQIAKIEHIDRDGEMTGFLSEGADDLEGA